MRTTLTLDDDVAAVLQRLRRSSHATLRHLVNEGLRRGLARPVSSSAAPSERRGRHKRRERTRAGGPGRLHIAAIDNIAEALAIAWSAPNSASKQM